MSTPNLPSVYDPLDANILTQDWLALSNYNATPNGDGTSTPSGAKAETVYDKITAEQLNGIKGMLREMVGYVKGTTQIDALDISGTLDVDGAVTFGGNLTLDDSNGTVFLGDGTANPRVQFNKGTGSAASLLDVLNGGTRRWLLNCDGSENLVWLRYNSSGVFQDAPFQINQSDGSADFSGDVTVDGQFILGDYSTGTKQATFGKADGQNSIQRWLSGSAVEGSGDFRYIHDTSQGYRFQSHSGSGWQNVWQTDAGSTAVDFAGNVTVGGYEHVSVTAGITASTTQSQGQGPLTTTFNRVSTVANTNDTVTLPAASTGRRVYVQNDGANTMRVYPASGDAIESGGGVNNPITLAADARAMFIAVDSGQWMLFTYA